LRLPPTTLPQLRCRAAHTWVLFAVLPVFAHFYVTLHCRSRITRSGFTFTVAFLPHSRSFCVLRHSWLVLFCRALVLLPVQWFTVSLVAGYRAFYSGSRAQFCALYHADAAVLTLRCAPRAALLALILRAARLTIPAWLDCCAHYRAYLRCAVYSPPPFRFLTYLQFSSLQNSRTLALIPPVLRFALAEKFRRKHTSLPSANAYILFLWFWHLVLAVAYTCSLALAPLYNIGGVLLAALFAGLSLALPAAAAAKLFNQLWRGNVVALPIRTLCYGKTALARALATPGAKPRLRIWSIATASSLLLRTTAITWRFSGVTTMVCITVCVNAYHRAGAGSPGSVLPEKTPCAARKRFYTVWLTTVYIYLRFAATRCPREGRHTVSVLIRDLSLTSGQFSYCRCLSRSLVHYLYRNIRVAGERPCY